MQLVKLYNYNVHAQFELIRFSDVSIFCDRSIGYLFNDDTLTSVGTERTNIKKRWVAANDSLG